MSWHLIEKTFDEITKQSTFIGKVWITILFVFRIIAVTRIGDTIYADEQAAFKCNTKEPGCENVCFNIFSPISHVRFWSLQIIIAATPAMMFMVYAAHSVSCIPISCKLNGRKVHFSSKAGDRKKRGTLIKKGLSIENVRRPTKNATITRPGDCFINSINDNKNSFREFSRQSSQIGQAGLGINANASHRYNIENVYSSEIHQDYPPAYNEQRNGKEMFEEIHLENISIPTTDCYSAIYLPDCKSEDTSNLNFALHDKSPTCDNIRQCSSDGNMIHSKEYFKSTRPLSWEKNSDASIATKVPNYSVLNLNSNLSTRTTSPSSGGEESNFERQFNEKTLPMTVIHFTPKSERDSAFYEIISSYSSLSTTQSCNSTCQKFRKCENSSQIEPEATLMPLSTQQERQIPGSVRSKIDNKGLPANTYLNNSSPLTLSAMKKRRRNSKSKMSLTNASKNVLIYYVERRIEVAYFVHCLFRLMFETTFLFLQYFLFAFDVPELYKCQRWPCPNIVDCYISRPNEKSIILYFMFGVTTTCIVISWIEICLLLRKRMVTSSKRKKMQQNLKNQGIIDTSSIGGIPRNKTIKAIRQDRYDIKKYPYLLEGNNKYKGRYSIEISDTETSTSKTTRTSVTGTKSEEMEQNSLQSQLSSMFDGDMADVVADYNNENELAEFA